MQALLLLTLLFFVPICLLIAYLAISSCLDDGLRTRMFGVSLNPRYAVYDRNYFRTMTNGGSAMSEQIELQEMLEDPLEEDYEL